MEGSPSVVLLVVRPPSIVVFVVVFIREMVEGGEGIFVLFLENNEEMATDVNLWNMFSHKNLYVLIAFCHL